MQSPIQQSLSTIGQMETKALKRRRSSQQQTAQVMRTQLIQRLALAIKKNRLREVTNYLDNTIDAPIVCDVLSFAVKEHRYEIAEYLLAHYPTVVMSDVFENAKLTHSEGKRAVVEFKNGWQQAFLQRDLRMLDVLLQSGRINKHRPIGFRTLANGTLYLYSPLYYYAVVQPDVVLCAFLLSRDYQASSDLYRGPLGAYKHNIIEPKFRRVVQQAQNWLDSRMQQQPLRSASINADARLPISEFKSRRCVIS